MATPVRHAPPDASVSNLETPPMSTQPDEDSDVEIVGTATVPSGKVPEMFQDAQTPESMFPDTLRDDEGGVPCDAELPDVVPNPKDVERKLSMPLPEEEGFNGEDVHDVKDQHAPRFGTDEHHLSANAIRQRTKRIFTPRVDGSLKVSEKIFNEWKGKGSARKSLEQIFKSVGYDVDSSICLNNKILYFGVFSVSALSMVDLRI